MSERENTQWTAKEISTAMNLSAEGFSDADIAQKMGRTRKAIYAKLWYIKQQAQGINRKKGVPGTTDVTPTVEPVTPKPEPVGSKRTVTTETNNTAVVTPTYPHHITVRIPKVLVAALLLVAVGVGGWLIGSGF